MNDCIFCPSSAPFPQKQYIFINLPLQALLRQSCHHHCLFQFIYHCWPGFFMYFIETSYQGGKELKFNFFSAFLMGYVLVYVYSERVSFLILMYFRQGNKGPILTELTSILESMDLLYTLSCFPKKLNCSPFPQNVTLF